MGIREIRKITVQNATPSTVCLFLRFSPVFNRFLIIIACHCFSPFAEYSENFRVQFWRRNHKTPTTSVTASILNASDRTHHSRLTLKDSEICYIFRGLGRTPTTDLQSMPQVLKIPQNFLADSPPLITTIKQMTNKSMSSKIEKHDLVSCRKVLQILMQIS